MLNILCLMLSIMGMGCQIIISRGRPTSISSFGYGSPGELAVDGSYVSTMYNMGALIKSCFHSNYENNPYWIVHFKEESVVNSVVIYNRMDCCSDRIIGSIVELLSPTSEVVHQCGTITETQGIYIFSCKGEIGSKVRIRNPGLKILHFCEVDVLGSKIIFK